jgi:hypothetical protein
LLLSLTEPLYAQRSTPPGARPADVICAFDQRPPAVAFVPLDLNLGAIPPEMRFDGPRFDAVATDSSKWSRIWRLIVDTGTRRPWMSLAKQ